MTTTRAQLLELAKALPPLPAAIIHPVTAESLKGAVEAAEAQLIKPVFIGPAAKIKKAAEQLAIDLSAYELIATEHSHAAAEQGVLLARSGQVSMLMKGSLHTDELMSAVLNKDSGLRTDRRMSHVFVMEIPTYHKLLMITDCAVNIMPNLLEKRDIVQNAIDLAMAIKINRPKVAILSAIETVTDKIPSTIEAAALCKMADRRQITGGILDGPLAFDNAISREAANIKNIESEVAGEVDILVMPNIEAGNMLAKQLEYLAEAETAGLVLGARIPIALASRADKAHTTLASCALGVLYHHYLQKKLCNKFY